MRLHSGTQGYYLVRIHIGERSLSKKIADCGLYGRHARSAPHHDHALNLIHAQLGITQGFATGIQCFLHQMTRQGGKDFSTNRHMYPCPTTQSRFNSGLWLNRQGFLGSARFHHQQARITLIQGR